MSATRKPAPSDLARPHDGHWVMAEFYETVPTATIKRWALEFDTILRRGKICDLKNRLIAPGVYRVWYEDRRSEEAESGAPLQPGATQPEHEGVAHETRCRAREWLITGGGGHEDGEDGIRAMTLCGEDLVETLEAYDEWMQERLTTLLERVARLVVEKAAKESHDAAFEYLGMRYKQRAYSWHEIADALAKSAEKIRAIANDKAKLQQLREAVERP